MTWNPNNSIENVPRLFTRLKYSSLVKNISLVRPVNHEEVLSGMEARRERVETRSREKSHDVCLKLRASPQEAQSGSERSLLSVRPISEIGKGSSGSDLD